MTWLHKHCCIGYHKPHPMVLGCGLGGAVSEACFAYEWCMGEAVVGAKGGLSQGRAWDFTHAQPITHQRPHPSATHAQMTADPYLTQALDKTQLHAPLRSLPHAPSKPETHPTQSPAATQAPPIRCPPSIHAVCRRNPDHPNPSSSPHHMQQCPKAGCRRLWAFVSCLVSWNTDWPGQPHAVFVFGFSIRISRPANPSSTKVFPTDTGCKALGTTFTPQRGTTSLRA